MESSKRILVICATSTQGRGCIRRCVELGLDVSAFARDPSSTVAKELQDQGAHLIRGDLDDPDSVRAAMMDIDTVIFIHPDLSNLELDVQRATRVVAAARAAPRVSMMVATTAVNTGRHESIPGWGPQYPMHDYWILKNTVEDLVRGAGFKHWVIIRPATFFKVFQRPIRDFCFPGFDQDLTLRVAYDPSVKLALIDGGDVGAVAASVTTQPQKYSAREIDLAAEALTMDVLASKLSHRLKKKVTIHFYDQDELLQRAKQPGGALVLASQQWQAQVHSDDAVESGKEFQLASFDDFLTRADLI
ncbi:hypothetical protein Daus18300_008481 [Diaporthe australafricana]|uniref:NmrA-like domain-containing protein n=1 Tax=Diaporthe australafricana TaxID=127596 RepID=A0ABR3WI77_9PEZI